MGVLARDDMHLIATNGGREKLDFVFGYVQNSDLSEASLFYLYGASGKKIDVRLLNFCCVGNLGVHMISKASFCLHQRRLMGSLDLAAQQ